MGRAVYNNTIVAKLNHDFLSAPMHSARVSDKLGVARRATPRACSYVRCLAVSGEEGTTRGHDKMREHLLPARFPAQNPGCRRSRKPINANRTQKGLRASHDLRGNALDGRFLKTDIREIPVRFRFTGVNSLLVLLLRAVTVELDRARFGSHNPGCRCSRKHINANRTLKRTRASHSL